MGSAEPRVTLVGRAGCHLCGEAAGLLARWGVEHRVLDVDVDCSGAERARWTDEVPVVLLDGRVLDTGRLDPARLERALRRGLRAAPGRWRPW